MISCFLQGGLGNQLFQICSTLSYSYDNNIKPVFNFNRCHLPHQGTLPAHYKDTLYSNLPHVTTEVVKGFRVYKEPSFKFDPLPSDLRFGNYILHGYFQSEKYFKHNRHNILKILNTNYVNLPGEYTKVFENYTTCSIHVRRGDYSKFYPDHPILDMSYYDKCIEYMNQYSNIFYFIFSDDLDWCAKSFNLDNSIVVNDMDDSSQLVMMSMCDHNIIANSTFSWWGAWLNNNNNKRVVAPKRWFGEDKLKRDPITDLIPEDWLLLS